MKQALDFERVHWLPGWAAVLVACVALAAVLWPAAPTPDEPGPWMHVVQPAGPQPGPAAVRVEPPQTATAVAPPTLSSVSSPCPLQRLEVSLEGQPARPACVDATRISQTGNVRSYIAAGSGHQAWALRVDVAGGRLMAVSLRSGAGSEFSCRGEDCVGLQWAHRGARGVRSLQLDGVRLTPSSAAGQALVSGRLEIPGDDAFSAPACEGAVVTMHTPDGGAQRFCGQGGAGVELTDAGWFTYRFEDAEGRSLAIAVDGEQRVAEIRYGPWFCRGAACTGASASSVSPGGEWSGRSFQFGRTPLFGVGEGPAHAPAPQWLLDGSLNLPAGES